MNTWEAPGFAVTWAPGSTLVTSFPWCCFLLKWINTKCLVASLVMCHIVDSMSWGTNHLTPSGYTLGNALFLLKPRLYWTLLDLFSFPRLYWIMLDLFMNPGFTGHALFMVWLTRRPRLVSVMPCPLAT